MDEQSRIPDPIQWDQGMLLTPRHFLELAGRYELLQQEMTTLLPLAWGVTRLEFDKEGLAAGKIEIIALEAVLPDGTFINAGRGDIPLLTLAEPQSTCLKTIYLAVPAQKEFAWEGAGARYQPSMNGKGSRAISRLRPNLFLYDGPPPQRFVALPVLRLECSQFSTKFVNNFEPPWLSVPGDSALIEICARIVALLRGKTGFLAAQIRNPAQRWPVLRNCVTGCAV